MQVDRTLSSLEGRLQARAAILARWHPDQTPVALQSALAAARAQWRDDEFDLAARDLERLDGELSTLIDHAEAREAEATKQQHLRDLFRAQAEVSTCSVRLQSLLAAGSPGLRTTFANEVRAASDWLAQRSGTITAATPATDLAGLASTVAAERQQGSVGHERLDELNRAFGERAAELRATRGAMVSEMEAAWNGGQELLGLWLEPSLVSDLKDSVIRVRQSLDADELLKVEAPATMLLAERQAPTQAATRQESLHQKRMYFLKALRQVCSEMGFQETAPPAFKDRDRRGSPIELAVDTLDRGAVTFFLGLNSIESDSCLSRDVCPEQFEKLADEIRARFGIGFELRPADGSKPDRKRKGELDEPDGGHHSQEK